LYLYEEGNEEEVKNEIKKGLIFANPFSEKIKKVLIVVFFISERAFFIA